MRVSINCVCGGAVSVDETYADGHARCPNCNRSIFVPAELFREAHAANAPAAPAPPPRPAAPMAARPAAPPAPPAPPQRPQAPPVQQAPAAPPAQAAPAAVTATATEAAAQSNGSGLSAGSGSGLSGGSGSGLASRRPVAPPDKSARPIKVQPRVEEPPPTPKKKSPLPMVLALAGILVVLAAGIFFLIQVLAGGGGGTGGGPPPLAQLGRPVVRISQGGSVLCYGFFVSSDGYVLTNGDVLPANGDLATDESRRITVDYAVRTGSTWSRRTATLQHVALREDPFGYGVGLLKIDLAGAAASAPTLAEKSDLEENAKWALASVAKDGSPADEPMRVDEQFGYEITFGVGSALRSSGVHYQLELDGAPAINAKGEVFAVALYKPDKNQNLMYLCAITPALVNQLIERAKSGG